MQNNDNTNIQQNNQSVAPQQTQSTTSPQPPGINTQQEKIQLQTPNTINQENTVSIGTINTKQNENVQNDPTKPTILLVEDDPLLIKMYKAKFESEMFTLITAEDGEEGYKLATTRNPSFIILDVMMPKLSGIDLLAKLKQNDNTKDIGVIVLSNLSQEIESKRAIELGAKEYILKASLTPSQLIAKIKDYLTIK